jgi:uncharacterized oxidoreductase
MLSLVFDPEAFGDAEAFNQDVLRLIAWVKAAPPITPDGKVLLPGELEEAVRSERLANGLPIDETTWRSLSKIASSLGVVMPED